MQYLWLIMTILTVLKTAVAYIEIKVNLIKNQNNIAYSIPAHVNGVQYNIDLALEDKEEYIVPLSSKLSKKKKKKIKDGQQLICSIDAVSMQQYSFQGWIRFIKHALLFIQGHYKLTLEFPLTKIPELSPTSSPYPHDSIMSIGPNYKQNNFFKLLKQSTSMAVNDIISIYRKTNGKQALIQIGGLQTDFAQIDAKSVQFYQFQLGVQAGKWIIDVIGVGCTLFGHRSQKKEFRVPDSGMRLAVSLEEYGLRLPTKISEQISRNFETPETTCKVQNNRLTCNQIPQSLLQFYSISLKLTQSQHLQFPLSHLVGQHNTATKQTTFNIEFTEDETTLTVGDVLFRNYYVSFDFNRKMMTYSKVNHFPREVYGVHIVRVAIGFFLLCVVAAIVARLWGGAGHQHQHQDKEHYRRIEDQDS